MSYYATSDGVNAIRDRAEQSQNSSGSLRRRLNQRGTMKDERKTVQELINELARLQQKVAWLEKRDREREQLLSRMNATTGGSGTLGATESTQPESDITELDRAKEASCTSQEEHRVRVENEGEAVWVVQDGVAQFANAVCEKILGLSLNELRSRPFIDFVHPDDREMVLQRHLCKLEGGQVENRHSFRIVGKDGEVKWTEIIASVVQWEGRPAILLIGTEVTQRRKAEIDLQAARDEFEGRAEEGTTKLTTANEKLSIEVAERARAEAALKESEAKYKTIVENIEEGYYEVDLAGNMVLCNDAMCRIVGYSRDELVGMNNRQYMDTDTAKKVYSTFNSVYYSGTSVTIPGWKLTRKDGAQRTVEVSVSLIRDSENKPCGFCGVVRDVTDRERFQMQLSQSQKMEAIGTLAGGIAHDFNNILYAMIGFTELALEEVPENTPLYSYLKAVLESGQRAKDLINQILTFSRQGQQERKLLNVGPIVKEGLKFLRASLPATIEIVHSLEPNLKPIIADPTQIHQILMNLCTNAAHAMREKGGVLDITLAHVELGSKDSGEDLNIDPGSYLRLTVNDTGTGMPPDFIQRIFDPYFTTKEAGEGTGLGLAVVHGIVQSCGGTIKVHSELGAGSSFQVYLPTVEGDAKTTSPKTEVVVGGRERILFVDDEQVVVEMTGKILERLGYDTTTRTSSIEALELFKAKANHFDLVITDMTMPGMTGIELTKEIRKIRSSIPVILCTGFSDLISEQRTESLGVKEVILKPILMNQMAAAIRRSLDD